MQQNESEYKQSRIDFKWPILSRKRCQLDVAQYNDGSIDVTRRVKIVSECLKLGQ